MVTPFPPTLIHGLIFFLGLLIGSFLNVCIARIPNDESIIHPRSHCPHCDHFIAWYDNIPVLSFLFLRGKCRSCHEKISFRYPLIEILTGILALLCVLKFSSVAQISGSGFAPALFQYSHLEAAAFWFFLFLCPLLVISWIDYDTFYIPDILSLPFLILGLLTRWIVLAPHFSTSVFMDSVLGVFVGGGSLWLVNKTYELIRKQEGIGGGDIKLLGMIGAFLGWKSILWILMLSSFLGSLIGIFLMLFKRLGFKSEIPFGPFLSIAAVLQLFYGPQIFESYFYFLRHLVFDLHS